jgi:hypothetical protein
VGCGRMDTTTPDEASVLRRMEHWGYYLLPKSHPASPGYGGLQVAIREEPTREHFDPQTIDLQVVSYDGAPTRSRLQRTTEIGRRHVPLTRIILKERSGEKEAKFFTFGGVLEAVHGRHETVFTLQTAAPVLDMTRPVLTIAEELAVETERLIGTLQAEWGRDDEGFGRRVARIGPAELYKATIHSLIEECRAAEAHHCSEAFATMLREEQRWLQQHEEGPVIPRTLEQLLAPPAPSEP